MHVDPLTYIIQVLSEKRSFCFGVPFLILPSIKFSSVPWFNLYKMVPPYIPLRSLFTPIVLINCFRIFVFSAFYLFTFLYQFTNLEFPHLPFGCQNPSSWQNESFSGLRFDKIQPWVIISLNLHYFVFALYDFHILTLIWKIPQILYIKLSTTKNICKWFQFHGYNSSLL